MFKEEEGRARRRRKPHGGKPGGFLFEVYFHALCSGAMGWEQSMHRILTVFVARTEFPQQGHIYFRVLLGFLALGSLPPNSPVRLMVSLFRQC